MWKKKQSPVQNVMAYARIACLLFLKEIKKVQAKRSVYKKVVMTD